MSDFSYAVCTSVGNDSVALVQWMLDNVPDERFIVIYNNTGWARAEWAGRMEVIAAWCKQRGVAFYETQSMGMEALVRHKKIWPKPASDMQFCTSYLKTRPTEKFLDEIDPDKLLTCVNGVRREESNNRRDAPEWVDSSSKHGGRELWSPMVRVLTPERDALIEKAGFSVLPHQSMECYPCVCANKGDLAMLDDQRIDEIEAIELSMGHNGKKNPYTMFRPYRVGGGVGIRQAVEWGKGPRGWKASVYPETYRYKGGDLIVSDLESLDENTNESRQCEGGYCGM